MRRFAAISLAFAGLASAPLYAQGLQYYTEVRGMVDSTLIENRYFNEPDLKETSVSETTGNAVARAQIAPGVNKVFAHFDSLNEANPAGRLMADAWTHWTDTVTISDPALDGTVGTFTASLRVSGFDAFNLTGGYASGDFFSYASLYGFWDSWIGTSTDGGGSFLVGGWFGDWRSDEMGDVWYSGDDLTQPLTDVTLEFIYGQPFLLRTNMEAYIDAENADLLAGTIDASLDFSHTTYWNGISGFFDANGNRVNPTGFHSGSGIDWRSSIVPEPAGVLALAMGWAIYLRRRR